MIPPGVHYLANLFKQFPFAEGSVGALIDQASSIDNIPAERWPRSFRVHVACMVSLVATALIPRGTNRLGFAYNANAQRSGKSLLAQTGICPVFGWSAGRSWPVGGDKKTDEPELRKILDGLALEGAPYVFFDNIKAQVDSPNLEAFMTLPMWTGRVMATQKTFTAPISSTIILTGNNMKLSVDLVERFLQCDLFVEQAEAQEREVENPIEQKWVMDHRDEIFGAVMSLINHWDATGRPGAPGRVRRGFETFGQMIGGIISAAGLGDLFERRREDGNTGNSVDNDMKRLVMLLVDQFGDNLLDDIPRLHFTFDDLVQRAYQNGLFTYYLEGREETSAATEKTRIHLSQSSNAKFGAALKSYAPAERGRTWTLPHKGTIRLQCQGEGRARKYVASLHLPARARIHLLMLRDAVGVETINGYLQSQGLQTTLDALLESHLTTLIQSWPHFVKWAENQS